MGRKREKLNAIKVGWKSYRDLAVPKTAGENQVEQTRIAFYAGATLILSILDRISESDVANKDGVIVLAQLHEELKTFKEEVYNKCSMPNARNAKPGSGGKGN